MSYGDYDFYRNVYGGAGSESEYARFAERVDMKINIFSAFKAEAALLGGDERVKTLLHFAHAAGVDAYRVTDGGVGAVRSESTDGYSVSYAGEERSAAKLIDGAIIEYLRQAKLVTAWI